MRRWCRRPDGPRARTRPKLHRVIDLLRTGAWLTLDRIRAYSTVLLIGYAVTFIVLFATAHGNNDMFGRPIGTDFSVVYVAGKSVLAGHPAQPYDLAQYAQAAQAMFGAATPEYGWFYPPSFLVPAALLALLPYKLAFLMWQGAGLAAFAILCAACLHWRRAWLPILAFPAVFVCLGHGQNGFCTAALFAGGLLALDRRPLLAGVLFGLLAYKPQHATDIQAALPRRGGRTRKPRLGKNAECFRGRAHVACVGSGRLCCAGRRYDFRFGCACLALALAARQASARCGADGGRLARDAVLHGL